MNKRTIDEMISYFNQEVSKMDISREYKMALLGMIAAIGYESKKQEVVRCKECKWWDKVDNIDGVNYGTCERKCTAIRKDAFPNENWFCADGTRKE